MSSLKRKDAPGGQVSNNSPKKIKETQPSSGTSLPTRAPKPDKSVVSLLKEEEPLFPRGGGSVLTPLEQKQIQLDAKADARREEEFNTGGKTLKKKKRKTALKSGKQSATAEEEENIKVESLSFKVSISAFTYGTGYLTDMANQR